MTATPHPSRSRQTFRWAFAAGVQSGFADFTTLYTWRTWTFGWLMRVVSQACLYGLFGRLIGSPERTRYLFVGGAVVVCAAEAMLACASTVNERRAGTLALAAAAPSSVFLVLLGRGTQWLPSGVATSLICLLGVGPIFGLEWTAPRALAALGLIVLTSVSSYCLGIALGSIVLAFPDLRNVVGTVAISGLTVVCGVAVPLADWPRGVQVIGATVPLTYTLRAVRALVAGGSPTTVVGPAIVTLFVGAVWLVLAWLVVGALMRASRRAGSLELGV